MTQGWTQTEIVTRRRRARYTALGLALWVIGVMLYTMFVFL